MRGTRSPAMPGAGRLSRREFLGGLAAAGAAVAVGPVIALGSGAPRAPRVVVVGAGAAGLRCALGLWRRPDPVPVTVYEAQERLGGRVWTNRDAFAGGQIAEHGAELFSTEHTRVRRLAADLGLALDNANGRGGSRYWIGGTAYPYAEADADFQRAKPALAGALRAAPFPQLYSRSSAEGRRLDAMSVPEWIDGHIEGGVAGRLGQLLLTDAQSEFGADPSRQSALNLIDLVASNTHLQPLAGTNERYRVAGGTDRLMTGLAAQLPAGSVVTGTTLVALRRRSDGSYACTFARGHHLHDVIADHVVLAIPFTRLREVDLAGAGLTPLKLSAIAEEQLGDNAKLAVQFSSRPWLREGYNGSIYADPSGLQVVWETTSAEPGPSGILVDFLGGSGGEPDAFGGAAPHGKAPDAVVQTFLRRLEPLFAGVTAAATASAYLDWWAADPNTRGAYSYYGVGQVTRFAGCEGLREGGLHFAGEHTDLKFQGYVEGALRSADRIVHGWPWL